MNMTLTLTKAELVVALSKLFSTLTLTLLLFTVGCDQFSQEAVESKLQRDNKNPHMILVTTNTPKGSLYRMRINTENDPHYVYFFDNSDALTVNALRRVGKTTVNEVVIINGKEYVPKVK
jgi:hypothetical protein